MLIIVRLGILTPVKMAERGFALYQPILATGYGFAEPN